MSSNKNLFYSLYSKSNNVISAGYTCNSAIDEANTSFDITVNSIGNSAGAITDSNGNPITNIDMSKIHAGGLTQYNSETRILQPHSCYVLQGQEYGFACAEYYFVIPKHVKETEGYEYYINCDFDVVYDNFAPKKLHIHAEADGYNSITTLINNKLKEFNVLVQTSLIQQYDKVDNRNHDYLKFMSQKEGYFYYINNIRIDINFQSEKYPNSPFIKGFSELKMYMYDLLITYHPVVNNEEYDPDTYEPNCDLYAWLLRNYEDAVNDIKSFDKMIAYLHEAINAPTPEEEQYWLEKANIVIQNTVYDNDLFNMYNIDNIEIIRGIVGEIKNDLDKLSEYYKAFYWLKEDKHLRIPLMKYPNGAFRGIVLIPEWPVNTDDYEYASLWINHIKSKVILYHLTKEKQYMPKLVGVMSNATLLKEERDFREQNPEFGSASVNNAINNLQDGFNERVEETKEQQNVKDIDTDYLDPYRPNVDVIDDLAWMGRTYYSRKDDIIGIFRYMQYVNDNMLWDKVGDAYMIIGKDDDPQSQDLNLPTSLLVYNPNDVPIKIKYLIFS